MANKMIRLLVCSVNGQRYGLPLGTVERLVRAVEVTPVAGAPEGVLGLVNVRGEVMPVVDMRQRMGQPTRPTQLSDLLVVVRTPKQTFALQVDETSGVREFPADEVIEAATIRPAIGGLAGVAKTGDEMVLIQELEAFLTAGEQKDLDAVMQQQVETS
jgi:purine-binding chemotaxis protein CheW